MFNGATPSPASRMSPGFHPPNSVIPSKRSRPDDGFLISSPRQVPGGIPPASVSRSQTPQHGAYPGYQPAVGGVVGANGASHFQPQAPAGAFHPGFQQPASSTASPSPVPQDFDAQRVQTASPSPFPSATQQPGQPPSDHGSRVATPQAPTSFPPGQPFPDPAPLVSGRPIVLMQLYATVMKLGGSQKVTSTNAWPVVAQQLQFPAMQYPTAAREPKMQQRSSLSHAESLSMSPNGQSIPSPSAKEDGLVPQTFNFKQPIPAEYTPMTLPEPAFHGPIVVDELFPLGDEILRLKPSAPRFHELGVIDIHALTMSLKSGLISETRLALDTLTTLSSEPAIHLSLENCDDLLPTLLDTATDHLELFSESNFPLLSTPSVVRFLALAIRYMGTRHLFLRTHQNTLDFMKDALIFLSNLAHAMHLPGRDEALALLYFLLSFAPSTSTPTSDDEPLIFPPYQPTTHRYLPAAVDSLAKLLARDDPNRTLYKSIFSDPSITAPTSTTNVSTNLLTRAFGLAISPIPEYTKGNVLAITEARKPFLMQGLLAAEVLSSLADPPLARAWLGSADGFAISLVHLAGLLSAERPRQPMPPMPQHPHQHPHAHGGRPDDMQGYYTIVSRALGILNRLGGKVRKGNKGKTCGLDVGYNVLPKKENILGALVSRTIDPGTLKLLCEYEGLSG
ncbi:uncharacterized protein GIQ15_00941 [Arthroderma uncinatum]|uniref:uncharacterized protein n=1 Tax=Arthroderma uncinatum TaxID=74035 RepID=UPI00144A5DA0|nr:uncharacterized protein GIQ15_00941 [Arthroderma uncinatum]KAF3491424.1 hypothetical protein GIQ15_00941 [Arthroderma uncinatum]